MLQAPASAPVVISAPAPSQKGVVQFNQTQLYKANIYGCCQTVAGGASIILSIAILALKFKWKAVRLWCGLLFVAPGILGILASKFNRPDLIISFYAMSIIACIFTPIQLGISADVLSALSGFTWFGSVRDGLVSMYAILLLLSIFEFVSAVLSAMLCSEVASCQCQQAMTPQAYQSRMQQTGIPKEGVIPKQQQQPGPTSYQIQPQQIWSAGAAFPHPYASPSLQQMQQQVPHQQQQQHPQHQQQPQQTNIHLQQQQLLMPQHYQHQQQLIHAWQAAPPPQTHSQQQQPSIQHHQHQERTTLPQQLQSAERSFTIPAAPPTPSAPEANQYTELVDNNYSYTTESHNPVNGYEHPAVTGTDQHIYEPLQHQTT